MLKIASLPHGRFAISCLVDEIPVIPRIPVSHKRLLVSERRFQSDRCSTFCFYRAFRRSLSSYIRAMRNGIHDISLKLLGMFIDSTFRIGPGYSIPIPCTISPISFFLFLFLLFSFRKIFELFPLFISLLDASQFVEIKSFLSSRRLRKIIISSNNILRWKRVRDKSMVFAFE